MDIERGSRKEGREQRKEKRESEGDCQAAVAKQKLTDPEPPGGISLGLMITERAPWSPAIQRTKPPIRQYRSYKAAVCHLPRCAS